MPDTQPGRTETGGRWPTPDAAYALAPGIVHEIDWTMRTAVHTPFGVPLGREFWLRKAALLDRFALRDEAAGFSGETVHAATEAARCLLGIDHAAGLGPGGYANGPYPPDHPDSTHNPRGYIRQEYALWVSNQ
ncbi:MULTISPECIES: hypothetical protein [unclassified Streptomyces]|uniref:hypothetical protein n=1 Tax=unclassified Streptomyces TaxID=2593676 RepID=UPI001929B323|nr:MULTISPECIES: hypothetical protein [unclassified Streptomyces]CAD5959366.1 protein of unknown function [Streptomyces sp. KY75]CAD5980764.1 protein of unknown function [Streptomyces sp. KY70]